MKQKSTNELMRTLTNCTHTADLLNYAKTVFLWKKHKSVIEANELLYEINEKPL